MAAISWSLVSAHRLGRRSYAQRCMASHHRLVIWVFYRQQHAHVCMCMCMCKGHVHVHVQGPCACAWACVCSRARPRLHGTCMCMCMHVHAHYHAYVHGQFACTRTCRHTYTCTCMCNVHVHVHVYVHKGMCTGKVHVHARGRTYTRRSTNTPAFGAALAACICLLRRDGCRSRRCSFASAGCGAMVAAQGGSGATGHANALNRCACLQGGARSFA